MKNGKEVASAVSVKTTADLSIIYYDITIYIWHT